MGRDLLFMTHIALVCRGYVAQTWMNTKIETIDARSHDGELIVCQGDVCPGMVYRDGVFLVAPPRVTPEQIKGEALRRGEGPFPKALQSFVALMGGQASADLLAYLHGVHDTAQRFLSMDSAPPDFQADRYWPRAPRLSQTSMPIATPMLSAAPVQQVPQEVRVSIDHQLRGPVIEHEPVSNPRATRAEAYSGLDGNTTSHVVSSPHVPGAVALELADGDDLTSLKNAIVATIQAVHDIHKGEFADADQHNAWLEQLASYGADVYASTTREGVFRARDRAEAFIRGG